MTTAPGTAADRIAAIVFLLLSAFVIFESRALPYWIANAPGPGFLPFWLAVLLACSAVALFARTVLRRSAGAAHYAVFPDRATAVRLAIVVGLAAGAAAAAMAIGLVLATAAFMGATLAYLRPGHIRANLLATLLLPIVVWLLFVRWLAVPLPAGPLGF